MAKAKVALGLTAGAVVAAVVPTISGAFAASGPPPAPPSITSGPSGAVTATSATFTYGHSQNVTFKCSLDGAEYKTCSPSGTTYSALAYGSHTFRVAAQTSGSGLSAPAVRTWIVDNRAPSITTTFPTGSHNTAAWNAGCATPGICGTASDPRGVASVQLSILQHSSGKFWNGTAFTSTAQVYKPAIGTTAWGYALPAPADGEYTVAVRATDGLGNMTTSSKAAKTTFTMDNVAPPAPVLTKQPDDPTFDASPHFKFDDAEAGVGFTCSLDGGPAGACDQAEIQYRDLEPTAHCFEAQAVDGAGNVSAPTEFCWTIVLQKTFTITGDVAQPFHPGASRPVDLGISNPYNFDIAVISVDIVVDQILKDGLANPACGTENLVTAEPFEGPVVVPRNATKSLSELGVPTSQWPVLQMPNLPTNQDACKATTFTFRYTGMATKP